MPARKGAGRPKKVNKVDLFRITEAYLKSCEETRTIPFLTKLAYLLNVDKETLSRYMQTPEYAHILKRVKLATEAGLIEKGLNENKPVFPIFLLKAQFGYIEAQKLDITSNGETLGVVELPRR